MKDVARQLRTTVGAAEPRLSRMNADEAEIKPGPDEWSKKEILGHLIDSAANNHQRFIRAVNNSAERFPAYDPEQWVRSQRYDEASWESLVSLWSAYNIHLSRVIGLIPEDAGSSPCNIGKAEPVPLSYVVADYLRHLRHHLGDILEEQM